MIKKIVKNVHSTILKNHGLMGLVKVDKGKEELGLHNFYKDTVSMHLDTDGMFQLTIDLDEPLVYTVPEGVEDSIWKVEVRSKDNLAYLSSIYGDGGVSNGGSVQVWGPLKFTINLWNAMLLLRAHHGLDDKI